MAAFGLRGIRSARSWIRGTFKGERARALFAGLAAHSMLPLENLSTVAVALALVLPAHAAGWPFVRGGAQEFTNALVSYLRKLGGTVITGCRVAALSDLPPAKAVLLDVTPRQFLEMTGSEGQHSPAPLGDSYRRKLERYRYGVAAFKIDWALDRPVPWRAPECALAGTVHLGGTLDEICESERHAARPTPPVTGSGWTSKDPFVLFGQPSLFDPTRAPAGKHTAWGYCHVPNGYRGDMTAAIEKQVERFAPGFRDIVLARSVMGPAELERDNPNLIGGDIAGGEPSLRQLFLRPTPSTYSTPLPGVYLCSSSTPPGPGVHGMCGFWAAERAIRDAKRGTVRAWKL
jgi:phytoene dehydrogenase-like protein